MASYEPIKDVLQKNKSYLSKKYHISRIGIFGSYARGDAVEGSDIDILVDLQSPIGLDFVTLAEELESMLRHRVDLVSSNAIKPKMMHHIRKDIVYV
jgi:predicted nucleotidyltransferase